MNGKHNHGGDMPVSDLFLEMDIIDEWDVAELEAEHQAQFEEETAQRSLEEQVVLSCAEKFQRLGLRLYEGLCEFGGSPKGGWLMLGDGEKQILGVVPSENEDAYFTGINEDGTPVLHYPVNNTARKNLDPLSDYIRMHLRCRNMSGTRRADLLRPVPLELHGKMGKAHLIKPKSGSHIWELTPLGARYGLAHGFLLLDGQKVCHTFFIPEKSLGTLKDLLHSGEKRESGAARKTISLEERLSRLAVGLPAKDTYAVERIKRLGAMPLEKYMQQHPETLEKLREKLPGEPINTVQEAAVRISEVWNTPGCSMETCKDLIWFLLVSPMTK